jgi:hypothetical protein
MQHAMGQTNEQQRNGGKNSVNINWRNVEPNDTIQFVNFFHTLNSEPYDYSSILQDGLTVKINCLDISCYHRIDSLTLEENNIVY